MDTLDVIFVSVVVIVAILMLVRIYGGSDGVSVNFEDYGMYNLIRGAGTVLAWVATTFLIIAIVSVHKLFSFKIKWLVVFGCFAIMSLGYYIAYTTAVSYASSTPAPTAPPLPILRLSIELVIVSVISLGVTVAALYFAEKPMHIEGNGKRREYKGIGSDVSEYVSDMLAECNKKK